MLVIGLICNLLVRPVADKWFMSDEELAEEQRLAHEKAQSPRRPARGVGRRHGADTADRWSCAGLAGGRHSAGLGRLPDAHQRGQVLPLSRERNLRSSRFRLDPGQDGTAGGSLESAHDFCRDRGQRGDDCRRQRRRIARAHPSARAGSRAASPTSAALAAGARAARRAARRRLAPRTCLIEHLHLLNDATAASHERHLVALARETNVPMAEVYEVATFYHHFEVRAPTASSAPALTVRVCDGLSLRDGRRARSAGAPAGLARRATCA